MKIARIALGAAGVALISAAAPFVHQGGYYRLRWAQLPDRYGFGQPVEAARLLIPANWRFEGGVQWGPPTGCLGNLVHASARASDQSGLYGLEIFTPYSWQWHDDPYNRQVTQQQAQYLNAAVRPCEMRSPVRATDFIRQVIVARYRQGAQILSVESLPQAARARQIGLNNELAAYIRAGTVRGAQVDAGRVVIAYQVNGRQVEESITGMVEMTAMPAMSASAASQGSLAQVSSYSIAATNLFAVRAPRGELSRFSRLYGSMIASFQSNPRWVIAVRMVLGAIGQATTDEAVKRSQIWQEVSRYTGEIITSQYRAQQEIQDRLASSYSQSVRGLETYVDPSTGGRVELTGGYSQAWSNGRGEYILSDDPNFNPAVQLHEQWTELQRAGNRR